MTTENNNTYFDTTPEQRKLYTAAYNELQKELPNTVLPVSVIEDRMRQITARDAKVGLKNVNNWEVIEREFRALNPETGDWVASGYCTDGPYQGVFVRETPDAPQRCIGFVSNAEREALSQLARKVWPSRLEYHPEDHICDPSASPAITPAECPACLAVLMGVSKSGQRAYEINWSTAQDTIGTQQIYLSDVELEADWPWLAPALQSLPVGSCVQVFPEDGDGPLVRAKITRWEVGLDERQPEDRIMPQER